MSDRAVTDLPHPDSPTRAKVEPSLISKDTPSTALASPAAVSKYVLRFFTSMTGSDNYKTPEFVVVWNYND